MHSSLSLEILEQISLPLLTVATAAINGSVPDLKRLMFLTMDSHPESQLFLPVFYTLLDPLGIPAPEQLELIGRSVDSMVPLRVIALEALRLHSSIPREAMPDLWQRVWPWIQFIHTYRHGLFSLPPEQPTAGLFMALIHSFVNDDETSKLVDSTKGVRVVVARAWAVLLHSAGTPAASFGELCLFIRRDGMGLPGMYIEEYIEGAGGDPADLASLVVKLIDRNCLIRKPLHLFCVIVFATEIAPDHGPFHAALVSHRIVKSVTLALCWITGPKDVPDIEDLQAGCFVLLKREFDTFSGYPRLAEALKTGLLRAIVWAGIHVTANTNIDPLQRFLTDVLAPATVHYSILKCMDQSLHEVEDLARTEQFTESEIFPEWRQFIDVLQERLTVMKQFDSAEYVSSKACDNLACSQIGRKPDFRCCKVCKSAYYCSRACQRLDWKQGGHREVCKHLQSFRIAESPIINTRNRSFMRALLDHDYKRKKHEIFMLRSMAMKRYPGKNFYLVFNYSRGPLSLTVSHFSDPDSDTCNEKPSDWTMLRNYYEPKTLQSAGRMELHMVVFNESGGRRNKLYPMRFATTKVHDGLVHLAQSLGLREDGIPTNPELTNEYWVLQDIDVDGFH
ncbi:hypothetical protein B0H10DRAFT_2131009 [Mycena sp. CBHHK59/15]|nr:hypothetical protein B0H10DRAFT_2131009 [Mycena sp. CBHHK59/15]